MEKFPAAKEDDDRWKPVRKVPTIRHSGFKLQQRHDIFFALRTGACPLRNKPSVESTADVPSGNVNPRLQQALKAHDMRHGFLERACRKSDNFSHGHPLMFGTGRAPAENWCVSNMKLWN